MASTIFKYFWLFANLFACAVAHADDLGEGEWSLLGPAIGLHQTMKGAPVTSPGKPLWSCRVPNPSNPNGNVSTWVDLPPSTTIPSGPESCEAFTSTPPHRAWHTFDAGIGIEYTVRHESHSDSVYAQALDDSYGIPGVMVGAARQWPVAAAYGARLDAGLTGGVWWRSDLDRKRSLMPFILPTLSISPQHGTGPGVEIALAPKLTLDGRVYISTTTLMIRTTYRFK